MTVLHRSLSDDMTNNTSCESLSDCIEELRESGSCSSTCLNYCLSICKIVSTPPPVIHHGLDHNIKKIIIITSCSIITTLFLLTLLLLCFKWHNRRRRLISLSRSIEEARTWDYDGPPSPVIIDHPVWHIRTVGLNPTVISSIKVCKYSKGNGVVEGTDCSVCLSEFEDEEMLRLLPKCRHAFHLSCIDTWLRSHTNCPLCRAPIVNDDDDDGEDIEETLVSISGDIDEESVRDDEEEADGFVGRDGEADKCMQRVRRSVSLDSMSGLRVSEVVVGPYVVERSSFLKRSISDIGK